MSGFFSLLFLAAFLLVARSYVFRTTPIVRSAPQTVSLTVRKHGGNNQQTEQLSLRDLLKTKCPSLFSDFRPPWWLFNGHLQTLYCILGDFSKIDLIAYRRKCLRLVDGGTLGLDFTPLDDSSLREETPVIVVTHGLTGGSYEPYVRAILSKACAPVNDGGLGYRAVVVNFRGCAGVPITSPRWYSAGGTDDLRQALMYISHRYPKAPLLGLGFSLGANVMTKYVAEEGERSRLSSCCALACPWNLSQNNRSLKSSFMGRYAYSPGLGNNLVSLVKKHLKSLTTDPDHRVTKAAENVVNLKISSLEHFDDVFARHAGGPSPPFPFATADDYYQWASTHYVINDIKIPFLAINAGDDPIVQVVPEVIQSDCVVIELTRGGGHLGWFQSGPGLSAGRWITKPVLEWLHLMGESIVYEPTRRNPIVEDPNGFLTEEGSLGLGCKELEGWGLIDWTTGEAGTLQGL